MSVGTECVYTFVFKVKLALPCLSAGVILERRLLIMGLARIPNVANTGTGISHSISSTTFSYSAYQFTSTGIHYTILI